MHYSIHTYDLFYFIITATVHPTEKNCLNLLKFYHSFLSQNSFTQKKIKLSITYKRFQLSKSPGVISHADKFGSPQPSNEEMTTTAAAALSAASLLIIDVQLWRCNFFVNQPSLIEGRGWETMLRENFSPRSRASFDEKCMFVNYVVENFLLN